MYKSATMIVSLSLFYEFKLHNFNHKHKYKITFAASSLFVYEFKIMWLSSSLYFFKNPLSISTGFKQHYLNNVVKKGNVAPFHLKIRYLSFPFQGVCGRCKPYCPTKLCIELQKGCCCLLMHYLLKFNVIWKFSYIRLQIVLSSPIQ